MGFSPCYKRVFLCTCSNHPKDRRFHTKMQEIFQQVGTFLLDSVPSMVLFVLLVIAYQVLVQGPLSKTLNERRARTSGAVEAAHRAVATAEARSDDYATKLRHARNEIFRIREQRLKEWAQQRETTLDKARKAASQRVLEARLAMETEAQAARKTLMASADQLAEQVVRAVMPSSAGGMR
jgi:F-type H+-transporting ATPase subunit b